MLHGLGRDDWTMYKEPVWECDRRNWKYVIKTVGIEGEELYIVIAVNHEYCRFEVLTRW